jgi:hypothetical protein
MLPSSGIERRVVRLRTDVSEDYAARWFLAPQIFDLADGDDMFFRNFDSYKN